MSLSVIPKGQLFKNLQVPMGPAFLITHGFEEISQRVCQYMTRMDTNPKQYPLVLYVSWVE